jgi:hypothetical protein
MARDDAEPGFFLRRYGTAGYPFDHCEWWGFPLKGSQKTVDIV